VRPKFVKLKVSESSDPGYVDLVATITKADFARIESEARNRHDPEVEIAFLDVVYRYFTTWDAAGAKALGERLLKKLSPR